LVVFHTSTFIKEYLLVTYVLLHQKPHEC